MDRSKGKENFNTILRLGRPFLPAFNNYTKNSTNTASHMFSVGANPSAIPNEEDMFRYYWQASYDLRIGSIRIHLHSTHFDDHGLLKFEEKLKTVKEEINLFVENLIKMNKQPVEEREVVNRRVWLNDNDTDNLATGYVGSRVDKLCQGQFFIADCHQTINIWIDEGKVYLRMKKISESIDRALKSLHEVREKFDGLTSQ